MQQLHRLPLRSGLTDSKAPRVYVRKPDIQPKRTEETNKRDLVELKAQEAKWYLKEGWSEHHVAEKVGRTLQWVRKVKSGALYRNSPPYKP